MFTSRSGISLWRCLVTSERRRRTPKPGNWRPSPPPRRLHWCFRRQLWATRRPGALTSCSREPGCRRTPALQWTWSSILILDNPLTSDEWTWPRWWWWWSTGETATGCGWSWGRWASRDMPPPSWSPGPGPPAGCTPRPAPGWSQPAASRPSWSWGTRK